MEKAEIQQAENHSIIQDLEHVLADTEATLENEKCIYVEKLEAKDLALLKTEQEKDDLALKQGGLLLQIAEMEASASSEAASLLKLECEKSKLQQKISEIEMVANSEANLHMTTEHTRHESAEYESNYESALEDRPSFPNCNA